MNDPDCKYINFKNLVFLLILSIVPMLWYGDGLISGLGLDLQTTPQNFLESVFYSWQKDNSLGTPSYSSGWLFPSATFFTILTYIGIPGFIAVRIWYSLILFTAAVSMYSYIDYFLRWHYFKVKKLDYCSWKKYRLGLALIAAVGYIANPFVVMHFDNGHFLISYAVFPLQLLLLTLILKQGRFFHIALFGLLSILVTTNQVVVLVNYIALFVYLVWYIVWINSSDIKRKIRLILLTFLLVGLNLLWFLGPPLALFLDGSPLINEAISQEGWGMYSKFSSFSETFRLLGIWGLYSSDLSSFYVDNPFIVVITYLLPFFAILSIVLSKKKYLLYFPISLILISLFMAVGAHESSPFRLIYIYFYEHIPMFPMFRNGYKFVSLLAFSYVMLITIFIYKISNIFSLLEKYYRFSLAKYLIISIFLISALPLYTGMIFNDKSIAHIPSYWKDASEWFNRKDNDSRIALFPDQYFDIYRWGAYGGFYKSAPYILNSMVYNNPTKSGNEIIQTLYAGVATSDTATHTYNKNIQQYDAFCSLLPSLGIKYIIQRNDIDYSVYNVLSPSSMQQYLSSQTCLKYEKSFGELDIYTLIGSPAKKIDISKEYDFVNDLGKLKALEVYIDFLRKNKENHEFSGKDLLSISPVLTNLDYSYVKKNSDDNIGPIKQDYLDKNKNCAPDVGYTEVNPTKYKVSINRVCGKFNLLFNENFDPMWKLYMMKRDISDSNLFFSTFFSSDYKNISGTDAQSLLWPEKLHMRANSFSNGWVVDTKNLYLNDNLNNFYTQNIDGTYNLDFVIEYWPQRVLYIMYLISLLSIFYCLVYVIYVVTNKKSSILHKKNT